MFRHTGGVIAAPVVMDPSELDRHFRTFQRQRDPAALAAVFDAAAPRLLLVAMHLGRDAATAEDPVQTVFLPVLRDADRCAPGQPVLPWLLGMVEHRAIDARRLAYRRRERAGPEVVGSAHGVADAAGTPPDLAADAEGRERVAEALAGMPRDYRDVLTRRLVHGLAAVDIAHSLGLSPATVRMRTARGLKLLRAALPRGLATPGLLAWLGAESLRARDGLQAVRATVLKAAGVGAGTTVGGSWLLGIAILLLCAVGAWSLAGPGDDAVAPALAPLAAPVVADADPMAGSAGEAPNRADGAAALAAG
ncbi:MAG: RNA polymerase sigma factor, partial [Planctomycetota bacterium]